MSVVIIQSVVVMHPLVEGGDPMHFEVKQPEAMWFWVGLFRMPLKDACAVIHRRDNLDECNRIAKAACARAYGEPPPLVEL